MNATYLFVMCVLSSPSGIWTGSTPGSNPRDPIIVRTQVLEVNRQVNQMGFAWGNDLSLVAWEDVNECLHTHEPGGLYPVDHMPVRHDQLHAITRKSFLLRNENGIWLLIRYHRVVFSTTDERSFTTWCPVYDARRTVFPRRIYR